MKNFTARVCLPSRKLIEIIFRDNDEDEEHYGDNKRMNKLPVNQISNRACKPAPLDKFLQP